MLKNAIAWLLMILSVILSASISSANHSPGTYPSRYFLWFSDVKGHESSVWLSSTWCHGNEATAIDNIYSTTYDTLELPTSHYPNGFKITRAYCDGTVNYATDILMDWMSDSDWTATGHGSGYWGEAHPIQAPPEYCEFYNAPYPCGSHPYTIHLKKSAYDDPNIATWYKVHFIMHEISHTNGGPDDCGPTHALSRDGTANCSYVQGHEHYDDVDRTAIDHAYPH